MRDQELFKQLHNLSKMKPDAAWKDSQRSVMLSQINAGNDAKVEDAKESPLLLDLFKLPIAYIQSFSQPVLATFLVAFLLLTGGFTGLRAAQDSKPGDSLYLAKIVGEKTQLALAFTDKKKVELGIGFAVKRVEEMKQVIAETEESGVENNKVEELVADFKKELSAAKSRIEKISEDNVIDTAETQNLASVHDDEIIEVGDNQIFSAGSSKTDDGLQVLYNNSDHAIIEIVPNDNKDIESSTEATSTEELEISTTSEEVVIIAETESLEDIFQQASDLVDASFDDILDILNDVGEVKGVEESIGIVEVSTSTEE